MKNILFLISVIIWISILFFMRYVSENINDTQLSILFVISLIVILILRSKLSINFNKH